MSSGSKYFLLFIKIFCVSIHKQLFRCNLPVFNILNPYVLKSTIGAVDPLKVPLSASMMWSENFKYNPYSFIISFNKIALYLTLAESFTWHFHITTFAALRSGKVKSTSTLILVVILPSCMCQVITAYF